jgi:hypothetical protein
VNFDLITKPNDERKIENWAWSDIDTPDDVQAIRVANDVVDLSTKILAKEQQLAHHLNFGREVILPNDPVDDTGDARNPLKVSYLIQKTGGQGNPMKCQLTGLRDSDGAVDYVLNYQITYWDLPN